MTGDRYRTARSAYSLLVSLLALAAVLWLIAHAVGCEPSSTPADAPPPVAITGADIGGRVVISSPAGEVEVDLDAGTASAEGWGIVEWEARADVQLAIAGSDHAIGVERLADGCTVAKYSGLVALTAQIRGCKTE